MHLSSKFHDPNPNGAMWFELLIPYNAATSNFSVKKATATPLFDGKHTITVDNGDFSIPIVILGDRITFLLNSVKANDPSDHFIIDDDWHYIIDPTTVDFVPESYTLFARNQGEVFSYGITGTAERSVLVLYYVGGMPLDTTLDVYY